MKLNKQRQITEIFPPLLLKPPYICARSTRRAKKVRKTFKFKRRRQCFGHLGVITLWAQERERGGGTVWKFTGTDEKIFVFVSAFIMMRIQMIQFRIKLNLDPDPGDTITQEFDSETDKNADRCT